MCRVGDIILIYGAKDNGSWVGRHPFLVLEDEKGIVRGTYEFDFVAALLSSNETEEKREKMLKYETNFPIAKGDKIDVINEEKNKDSFVALDPIFYFSKDEVSYFKLCSLSEDIFNLVVEYIEELNSKGITFRQVLENAKPINEANDD